MGLDHEARVRGAVRGRDCIDYNLYLIFLGHVERPILRACGALRSLTRTEIEASRSSETGQEPGVLRRAQRWDL